MDEARYTALRDHLQTKYGVAVLPLGTGDLLTSMLASLGVVAVVAGILGWIVNLLLQGISGMSLGLVVFVDEKLPPQQRAEVLVHEVSHSLNVFAQGVVTYFQCYFLSTEMRSQMEAGPCVAAAELHHACTGEVWTADQMIRVRTGYLLPAEQIGFAIALGEQETVALQSGLYCQPVAIESAAFLKGLA